MGRFFKSNILELTGAIQTSCSKQCYRFIIWRIVIKRSLWNNKICKSVKTLFCFSFTRHTLNKRRACIFFFSTLTDIRYQIHKQEFHKCSYQCKFIPCVVDSGRVKVFVRVRPPRPQENSRKEPIAVNVQELSSQVSLTQNLLNYQLYTTIYFSHFYSS